MHPDGNPPPSSERRRWVDKLVSGARPGEVLAGKYRIDRILGSGGVGVVVAATHLQLDERVAIKFLLPEALKDQEAVVRFDREARAAVKIKSEHVARVTDVGRLETGAPYTVMEYLEGRDLAMLLEAGPVSVEAAVEYVLQACEAIAEAHALGIIHRDVKPSNLFLTRRTDGTPQIKVLDFGISKIIPRQGSQPDLAMTRATAAIGSPLYMSPEQMETPREVDERTDIWALGVTLYELLTACPAFDGPSMPQVCAKIMNGWPPPIRIRVPNVPPALETVVLKCLAKKPAGRFADVGELAVALLPFAPRRAHASARRTVAIVKSAGVARTPIELPPESAPMLGRHMGIAPSTQGAWGSAGTEPPRSSGRAPLIGATIAGIVVVGAIVGFIASKRAGAMSTAAPLASEARPTAPPEAAPPGASVELSPLVIPDPSASAAPADSASARPGASSDAASTPATKNPVRRGAAPSASPRPRGIDPTILDDR